MANQKSDLALAWQVRQARSKGFKALVRKELPDEQGSADLPLEAGSEQHSELGEQADEPKSEEISAAETPKPKLVESIVRKIRQAGI